LVIAPAKKSFKIPDGLICIGDPVEALDGITALEPTIPGGIHVLV
jgi:hypothetical protein